MAEVAVYPREGTTYPDAAGVPITSAGAIVDVSKYIRDAIGAGFLLTWDPLGVYQPDDRTDTGGGGGDGGSSLSFNSAASMTAFIGDFDGQVAELLGYHTQGDGGGGTFYWDQGSATTADGGLVFGASPAGRWKRIFDYPIHTRWFGAKGDGIEDDTARLQAWINSVTWGKSGYSDPGLYKITAPLAITEHHTTFDGTQAVTAPDSKGFCLDWHGAESYFIGEDWAVYVTGISIHIKGWNIRATTDLWGGFHAGQMNWSSIINTRCHFVDCCVDASEFPGAALINHGFGVGAHWQSVGRGNQDFNYFENCFARNCYLWGWIIHGGANCIQTTLRRCVIMNIMGIPNGRKYIEAGLSDGDYHTYGGGILTWDNAGIDIDGINFAYLETGFARMQPVTQGNSFATNDRIVNFDCELTKKLCKVRTSGRGTIVLENGRFAHPRLYQAGLGPYEWPADDYRHIDIDGPVCRLSGLSYAVDDDAKYDDSIYLGAYGGEVSNCTLPSFMPFVGKVTTFACYGATSVVSSPYAKIADGTYTWQADGTAVPPPAAIAEKYLALLGDKLWDFWSADYGVEVNTAGEVLGWTSAVQSVRLAPAGAGNRPTYATDGSNFRGKPVVHTAVTGGKGLAGTASATQTALGGNTGSNVWSISVYRLKTIPGTGPDDVFCVLDCGTPLSNDVHMLEYHRVSNVNTLRYVLNNGTPSVTDVNALDTDQHAYICYSNGSVMAIQQDSDAATTAATALGTNTGVRGVAIGRRVGTAIYYSDCAHAFHLICQEPPTSGELASLLQLIASDWSIV